MKRIAILSALAILSAAPAGAAQLYRWVDDKGNVEYRDTPPPSSAKKVEQRRLGESPAESSTLPFSLQQAVKNFPVTLWIFDCGRACDQPREHLQRRGVPYTEQNPQDDLESFKKLTGGTEVPVLYIGSTRVRGYLESEWDAALDFAGYPRTPPPGVKPKGPAAKPARALPPVKLYSHPDCGPVCEDARNVLARRGVQFEEIVAVEQALVEELQKVSGDVRVPVLLVGQAVTRGFSAAAYDQALDAAGFGRSAPPAAKP
jgi:glutaredoxin